MNSGVVGVAVLLTWILLVYVTFLFILPFFQEKWRRNPKKPHLRHSH